VEAHVLFEPSSFDNVQIGDNDNDNADFVPPPRPRTRGDCVDGPRPCPWVSCRHHPFFGEVRTKPRPAWPGLEPDELPETCTLDVADRGESTLAAIGDLLNLTRERVRQIELEALAKFLKRMQELND
jgi:hypothetical protein